MSVAGTEDVWFVNFYSPQCSHCHHLAPTVSTRLTFNPFSDDRIFRTNLQKKFQSVVKISVI